MALILLFLLSGMHPDRYQLPNPDLTPGVVRITEKNKVCGIQWGKDVRHVTRSMKMQVCSLYAVKECPGPKWELDHLISRELGGADDIRNLWPQPIKEARIKDRIENFLHRQVCAGALELGAAQRGIATDWTQYLYPK